MHLHGFYYDVTSVGTLLRDDRYSPDDYRTMVTEFMPRYTTMVMEWVASRPGSWLFHCHNSFHVYPELRLPGVSEIEKEHSHMAGLVLGIQIPAGPNTDLISKGEPRFLTLESKEYDTITENKYQLFLKSDEQQESARQFSHGPPLILKQYQPTFITVENNLSLTMGIHWHGLEIDSWADGVPLWSSSEGITSPLIHQGEAFTYKLSPMRAGSFIYHTHLDDVYQLTEGLYGPLIVLGENETYDPKHDHYYLVGWKTPDVKISSPEDFDLNGWSEPPIQHTFADEIHRIRIMHIAPAGNITVGIKKDDHPFPMKFIAKDGADLPENQQRDLEVSPRFGVGETADFAFTPTEAGVYELHIGYPFRKWVQIWEVNPKLVQ